MWHIALLLYVSITCIPKAQAQDQTLSSIEESMIQAFKSMKADTIRKDVIEPNLYRAFYKAEYHLLRKVWRQPMNGRKYCKSEKRPSAI